MHLCTPVFHPGFPDAGEGACCWEAMQDGPEYCTCWEPVYETVQQPVDLTLVPVERAEPCVDCAYRPDSPERQGDEHVVGDEEFLLELVQGDNPFWCHQGMKIAVEWRHPSGVVHRLGHPAHYEPPKIDQHPLFTRCPVPYKLDGTPGDICAGWAARRRLFLADLSHVDDGDGSTIESSP